MAASSNPLHPNWGPLRGGQSPSYTPAYTANGRDYDPALDGWDVHKRRAEPTLDEMTAALDDPDRYGEF